MPEGALTSCTVCDAHRYLAGQALLMTSQSRSSTTDNIIGLDWYINLSKKCNLVDRLLYHLIQFLIIRQWLTFWGRGFIRYVYVMVTYEYTKRLSTVGDRAFGRRSSVWNELPRHVTTAPSLYMRWRLDRHNTTTCWRYIQCEQRVS